MAIAPLPDDEHERLAALRALDIVGTETSPDFDIFPELAAGLFAAPVSAVSLLEADRQWFKASIGLEIMETPREQSFCAHAILDPDKVLYVPDATKDPRFAQNALVTGEFGLRFYAGAPIMGPTGHAVGALCVIDRTPREVSSSAIAQLKRLAIGVGSALKLHASMQEARNQSMTDALTGLWNRAGFEVRLREALKQQRLAPGSKTGLLFLDLDGFKSINDLFGHSEGDQALQEVAARVRDAIRIEDVACRFGGDEFCVIVKGAPDTKALELIAARIHEALAEPYALVGEAIALRTSIGVALYPDHALTVGELVRVADKALYRAKRAGRGTTRFAQGASRAQPIVGRLETKEMLRNALLPPGNEPFTLAVQPVMNAVDGRLLGFEALVRWPMPERPDLLPGEFIPHAEATGLVVQLDRFVLRQACALAAGWRDGLTIASNLSAANFISGNLVDEVQLALERNGMAPERLKLEITETVLLREQARVRGIIDDLRRLGVQVMLDDFGAGHASIAYLRDYAFSGLKIDRSFTSTLETDPRSVSFVRAIVGMAEALGIETVAEGVETSGQLRLLQDIGVGSVQGYLLGRPMTAEQATDFMVSGLAGMPFPAARR